MSHPFPSIGVYKFADVLGKGGFGTVFRAFNTENGVTVAVKRVNKEDLDEEKLGSIESEVKLLKKLRHPNIVRYIETVRGPDGSLNIVLEFIENGSLASILKKFGGKFNESLVAIYTTQVLKGLAYLHAQGVVHRDIKGANILATKDGTIKLADFGVATEGGDFEGVVGTPYWMAPEIIEMTGNSGTACDIWSVGCTVIELVTGAPPYFDLNPMPALFRIVQDEHPPLPDNISSALKEFLLACFQKDPNLRISAEKLLEYKWLKSPHNTIFNSDDEHHSLVNMNHEAAEIVQQTIKLYKKIILDSDSFAKTIKNSRLNEKIAISPPAAPAGLSKLSAKAEVPVLYPIKIDVPKSQEEEEDMSAFDTPDPIQTIKHSVPLPLLPKKQGATPQLLKPSLLVPMKKYLTEQIDSSSLSSDLSKLRHFDSSESTPADTQNFTKKLQADKEKLRAKSKISYLEKDNDENFDDFGDVKIDAHKLSLKKSTAWDELSKRIDEVANFDFGDDAKESHSDKFTAEVTRLIKQLSPKTETDKLLEVIKRMEEIFVLEPQTISKLMSNIGVIPIMEMLEVNDSSCLLPLLKFVARVIQLNSKFSQSLCLVGLVPAVIKLASAACPEDIRVQAAFYIKHFCSAGDFSRKMFIACGGLPVLVHLLEKDYSKNEQLAFLSIDCIFHVFETSSNPKNDFYRLFCKFDLLRPLAIFYQALITKEDAKDVHRDYAFRIAKIIQMFSQGDVVVKVFLSRKSASKVLLDVIDKVPHEQLLLLVKSFRHLSMDDATLDYLEAAEIIPKLIPFLASATAEVCNQVLMTMHYLCKIKNSRQEAMSAAGIIPFLMKFIREDHPLKQFALPMLKSLAACSATTRLELRKHGGLEFFVYLLDHLPYWRAFALDAISFWMTDNVTYVDLILTQPQHLKYLVCVLADRNSLVLVLNKLSMLLAKLSKTSRSIGNCGSFVTELLHLLKIEKSAIIRKPLLLILATLFDKRVSINDQVQFVDRHKLVLAMHEIASDESAVLVQDLAVEALQSYKRAGIVL